MLADMGLLSRDFLAVHCVHMDERDLELLAEHEATISYNPVSNMYLGSGVPPIVRMSELDLPIGLATDGSGSNNSQDMLETLKFGGLLQRVATEDASVADAQTSLDWATRQGAEALRMDGKIGRLEPGYKADFFLVDPFTPKAAPVHDPLATLVYSSGQANVVTVVANGQVLLEEGSFQHLDEASILADAQASAEDLAQRAGTSHLLKGRRWRPRAHPTRGK